MEKVLDITIIQALGTEISEFDEQRIEDGYYDDCREMRKLLQEVKKQSQFLREIIQEKVNQRKLSFKSKNNELHKDSKRMHKNSRK